MMGGDLVVESRAGEGSKFTVWLPTSPVAVTTGAGYTTPAEHQPRTA
jgi:hypothetical protein